MQITLNQAEIELAIKNYINEQVNIREGNDITIDLRAGRGPEGFTATIDIVAGAVQPVPVTATGTVIASRPKPPREPQEAAPAAQEEAQPEAATDTTEQAETAADEQAEAAGDEADQTTAPRKGSLFGNLQKPRNN